LVTGWLSTGLLAVYVLSGFTGWLAVYLVAGCLLAGWCLLAVVLVVVWVCWCCGGVGVLCGGGVGGGLVWCFVGGFGVVFVLVFVVVCWCWCGVGVCLACGVYWCWLVVY
jgi:hypothetical protein